MEVMINGIPHYVTFKVARDKKTQNSSKQRRVNGNRRHGTSEERAIRSTLNEPNVEKDHRKRLEARLAEILEFKESRGHGIGFIIKKTVERKDGTGTPKVCWHKAPGGKPFPSKRAAWQRVKELKRAEKTPKPVTA